MLGRQLIVQHVPQPTTKVAAAAAAATRGCYDSKCFINCFYAQVFAG